MSEGTTVNDFVYVKQTLCAVFHRMNARPFTRLCKKNDIRRGITDIQWMLHHHYYPSPGQVGFIIFLLRDEKFRVEREEGHQSSLAVEIQSLIDVLKDIRKYLQFVTQYDCDGCIITLNARTERKYLWIFPECVIVFILCAMLFFLIVY
ncbi:hypothetical protein [Salmonella enterica]|uniref:hypothetical protein n=1 Tax=Salmonella enterica TaxID=28901 RepID=UPI001EFCF80E|nr:hypothetical protein [Salmonella enterica]